MPLAPGDFTLLIPSPVNLTCVTSDPTSGLIYAQEDNGTGYYVYDPGVDSWSPLASAPLNSGNNGGAAYQGGKIYMVYTGNNTTMGVYDIASNTWSTMPNGLGGGTGVIASDGTYRYLASYSTFKRYDPVADEWANLTPPSIVIEPWGGMAYWNGRLYVHHGNGATEFAMYEIATGVWTTLPSLPSGAVLGSAIDPVRRVYYAYGSYDGNNWYAFNLDSQSWITETIPFFNVEDGGMTYVSQAGVIGIYFIQGEGGSGFARLESVPPVVADSTYLGASPMRLTCLASNPFLDIIYAQENNGA